MRISDLQDYLKSKDFHPELKHDYFLKLSEEFGELAEAIRKDRRALDGGGFKGSVEEELYDILYYTLCLANVYGIDLERWILVKERLNDQKYGRHDSEHLKDDFAQ
ncbi:MAG: hypothetical protein LBT88_07275 [Oscillospiraceae bacterium]|jgi:NTP pyrophosphatase (non-canonical NTP hydrolase)|nr:hypothetical protein [Oscillospiraceae bacterium]